jgi:site-specific DNA-methyltransferase (adenine-specific)
VLILDKIFGANNFKNHLIWYYKNASRGKYNFAYAFDTIFWYTKSNTYCFNRNDVLIPFESKMTEWRYTCGGQKGKEMPEGKTPDNVIELQSLNTMSKERIGYPTQKPEALLERIIKASSNKGDIVLDPFVGGGTTIAVAERLNRRWIGIDQSVQAIKVTEFRLEKQYGAMEIN